MAAPVITTDETNEAIGAVAKALVELQATKKDPNNWKWTIIALHNALQNFMVVTLRFSNNALLVRMPSKLRGLDKEILAAYNERTVVRDLPDKVRKRYIERIKEQLPEDWSSATRHTYSQAVLDGPVSLLALNPDLISFGELFSRLQDATYAPFTPKPSAFPLPTTEAQRDDVDRLNALRNDFIHFSPKSLTIVLEGSALPRIVVSCAAIMLHLVEQGNVLWHIMPAEGGGDMVRRVSLDLRAMQDEARAIAAAYGTSI